MERRKLNRAAKEFAVNITSVELDGQRFQFDRNAAYPKLYNESGVDFTHAGVRLISSKVLPDSARVVLKMLIPDSGAIHTVRAAGTVKWSHIVDGPHKKYYEMGIEFTDIAAHDIDILQRLWQQYA